MSMPYLVSYDITDPKRLVRLHRALKKQATPVQYSVFLGLFTPARLIRCQETIRAIIDRRTDDVRIYPLPAGGQQRRLGRATLPAGIGLTLLPVAFRALPPVDPPSADAIDDRAPAAATAPDRQARRLRARAQTGQRRGLLLIG